MKLDRDRCALVLVDYQARLMPAITGGDVTVTSVVPAHLRMELAKLGESGCEVETGEDWVRVVGPARPRPLDFATLPFPGFATDMHPQMVAYLSIADGTRVQAQSGIASSIKEPNQALFGAPAIDYNDYVRAYIVFKNLPELQKKVRTLERILKGMQESD